MMVDLNSGGLEAGSERYTFALQAGIACRAAFSTLSRQNRYLIRCSGMLRAKRAGLLKDLAQFVDDTSRPEAIAEGDEQEEEEEEVVEEGDVDV